MNDPMTEYLEWLDEKILSVYIKEDGHVDFELFLKDNDKYNTKPLELLPGDVFKYNFEARIKACFIRRVFRKNGLQEDTNIYGFYRHVYEYTGYNGVYPKSSVKKIIKAIKNDDDMAVWEGIDSEKLYNNLESMGMLESATYKESHPYMRLNALFCNVNEILN